MGRTDDQPVWRGPRRGGAGLGAQRACLGCCFGLLVGRGSARLTSQPSTNQSQRSWSTAGASWARAPWPHHPPSLTQSQFDRTVPLQLAPAQFLNGQSILQFYSLDGSNAWAWLGIQAAFVCGASAWLVGGLCARSAAGQAQAAAASSKTALHRLPTYLPPHPPPTPTPTPTRPQSSSSSPSWPSSTCAT